MNSAMPRHVFDKKAWLKMDRFGQLGNIGSEVSRALTAKQQGKFDRMQSAFQRGLDLIDLTAEQWAARRSPNLRELLYARELFAQSITTDNLDASLENYFFQFALAARRNK